MILEAGEEPKQLSVDSYFINKNATHHHGWNEFIIRDLQPFSCIKREQYRSESKFYSLSVDTLVRYLPRLTKLVEQNVAGTKRRSTPSRKHCSRARWLHNWLGSLISILLALFFPARRTGIARRCYMSLRLRLTKRWMQTKTPTSWSSYLKFLEKRRRALSL